MQQKEPPAFCQKKKEEKRCHKRKTYFFTVKAYKKYKGKTYTGSSQTKKAKVK